VGVQPLRQSKFGTVGFGLGITGYINSFGVDIAFAPADAKHGIRCTESLALGGGSEAILNGIPNGTPCQNHLTKIAFWCRVI